MKTQRRLQCVTFLLPVIATVVPQFCWAQFELDQPVPFDSATTVATLPNGLRYYIRVNREPQKRAELRLAVNVGSVLEDDDQLGLAHFVEHMGFNGTRDFKAQELVNYLQSIGMRFGADINASTGFDQTVYRLTVPTDDDTTFAKAFSVLENWARWLAFDPQEIEKERGVVIEEWRLGRGAAQRIRDRQFPILFKDSRYAERLAIGKKEILESFEHETLKRYYRTWYRPGLMAIVAVGDFDPAQVEALVRQHFGAFPADPVERPEFTVPEHEGTLFAVATDKEETTSRVTLYTKFPRRDPAKVEALRRSMVENLFTQMLNSRLQELTQLADPPFINAFAFRTSLVRTVEAYALGATVQNNGIERGLEAVLTEAERAARHGFTAPELERAKKELLSQIESQYKERDKTDSNRHAQARLAHFLNGVPVPGPEYLFAAHQKLLPEIQIEETNAVARLWNADRNRTVLASGPEKEGVLIPDEPALRAVMERLAAATIVPYVDKTPDVPLVARLPEPGKIVDDKRFADLDLRLWTLSNGARVYVKTTDFKDDEILLRGWSKGGSSLAADADWISASTASWVVSGCGLSEFTPADLEKLLAGKQVSINPYIAELSEGFNGNTRPQDMETMFQLLYLYFTAPRSDATVYQGLKTRYRGFLENRAADPNTAFGDSLTLVLSQYHPRSMPMTAERLDAVQLDAAYAFFKERIADADDFTFALVGRIDVEALRPLVERYIGGLAALPRRDSWRDVGRRPPRGVVQRGFRRGVDDKARTSIVFTGPCKWNRQERYALQSLAEALRIRLREEIREEKGGTYGVGVFGNSWRDPEPQYRFQISFSCAPARLDELSRRVFEVLASVQESGIAADEVTQIHEIQRREYEVGLRENDTWIEQIEFRDSHGLDLREILDYPKLLEKLSSDLVREAAGRYLKVDNYVQISMLPETEPAQEGTPAGDKAAERGKGSGD